MNAAGAGGTPGRNFGRTHTVLALGTAQTLAWASSYYLPAMLAEPMARALGVSVTAVFAAFSVAMLVFAATGKGIGRVQGVVLLVAYVAYMVYLLAR